ncbi:MAG: hypothetical protein VKI63_02605 [Cyanobium sp.]|nr:hypothetical protein [Cyanobium sp.]
MSDWVTKWLDNLAEWGEGWGKIDKWPQSEFREGWGPKSYKVLYATNILVNVLTGGAPWQTLSARMHGHRETSKFAAAVLWLVELVLKDHGAKVVKGHEHRKAYELPSDIQVLLAWCLAGLVALFVAGLVVLFR